MALCRLLLVFILTPCLTLSAADAAAQLQTDLAAIVAQRDAVLIELNKRLAADAAEGAMVDYRLEARELHQHQPLVIELYQRGKRFFGGPAHLTNFNHGQHRVLPGELSLVDGRLSGTLQVQLNPDQWVPADKKPRFQQHQIDARIADGQVTGTYQFTGELGPDKDRLIGTATAVAKQVSIAAPAGTETGSPAELIVHVVTAYRQLRAAALALRDYPASYERCLAHNRISPPVWQGEHEAEWLAYAARLRRIAETYEVVRSDHKEFAVGFVHPEDDRFGPFFEARPLAQQDGVASLPADLGQPGPQRWHYIEHWTVTGPFPAPYRIDYPEPQLPEWIPAPSATYLVKTADMPGNYIYPDWYSPKELGTAFNSYSAAKWLEDNGANRPAEAKVHDVACEARSGRWQYRLLPPRWMVAPVKVPLWGSSKSVWFARTTLQADKAGRVWVECHAQDAGQLWVNDRLVWQSVPDLIDVNKPKIAVFPIDLLAGSNDLVLRVRNDDPQSGARLLFCTRGRPADAEAVAQRAAAVDTDAETQIGFRGNGMGRFPAPASGKPPVAFDLAKDVNVRWQIEMPAYSHAYPIIIGDKVLTTSEPHRLYCYDKLTGKELWQVDSSLAEFMPAEQREQAEQAFAFLALHNTQVGDPEIEDLKRQRREIEMKLRDSGDRLDEKKKKELRARSKELNQTVGELTGSRHPGMKILREHGCSTGGWHEFTGFAMATPISDGTHIWVRFATGTVACYDLDGKRQWMVDCLLRGDIPCVSTPVLIGDVLVVEGGVKHRARATGVSVDDIRTQVGALEKQDLHFVVGLDAMTGKELWATPVKCGIGGYGTPGGPRGMRLPGKDGPVDVILTQRNIIRARDGKTLHDATGTSPGYAGFTMGNRLVSGSTVTAFWAESEDLIGVRHLVRGKGWDYNGNVLGFDGRLYGNPDSGVNAGRAHIDWQTFQVSDLANGKVVHRVKPVMEGVGNAYTPPAICGDYVYMVDTGKGGHDTGKGRMLIAKTGNPPMVLARCDLDAICYAGPVFDDGRLYLRTRKSLWCLEASEAGEALTYDKGVEELFSTRSRLPLVPEFKPVADLAPLADFTPTEGMPVCKLYERLGPPEWLVAGPFPYDKTFTDHLAEAGGCAAIRPVTGMAVAGQTFTPLEKTFISVKRGMQEDLYGKKHFGSSASIDLTGLTGGKGNATHYLATVIEVTRPRVARWTCKGKGYRAWFGGQEIKDGQVMRLQIGYYPLLLRTEIGRLPPFAKGKKIVAKPYFSEESDPQHALAAWRRQVEPYRARLEEVLVKRPNTPQAFDAERYLGALGPKPQQE